ncbi:hypothetical protein BOX15_Mlig029453g2 [Macrostomum lignano]|uniref:GPR158/179 extracellular domain-containing protein n=1 Tax=Macrostomum lignano TaxID=282301 RepID=A0A267FTW9_9PLAT|nr:hypothetical protein BOX15_Mlig029453g3 [Macrostomum lignano]PAA79729.1 hypothetical protein BOX15_Mlig029453g2 [Macrostomum lignano]
MGLARVAIVTLGAIFVLFGTGGIAIGPYRWMTRDNFDAVMEKMDTVNEFNCKEMSSESLRLPANSVGQRPKFNVLPQIVIFPNRTNLIHMHNMALNRAYFYSYILQRLNESQVTDFPMLPGMLYYYMGASADVSSGVGLMNGSGVLFDTHTQYANWYPTILLFNNTLPLFGPKAFLVDDFQDPVNWLREPTNNTIRVDDLGSGPGHNYTASWHPLNSMVVRDVPNQIDFIPDLRTDYRAKHQYDYLIYNATRVGEMERMPNIKRQFFGPPSPGISEPYQPVYFTRPYFDCGRSNKWIVSAVAPVIDFMVRYSIETKLRRPQYVAITVTDLDFLRIDFDPCDRSVDSPDRTYFSGVARCRSTTLCEPLPGHGYQRGGYVCHCRPGYRYPYWQNGPFLGRDIEQASEAEADQFECIPVEWKLQRLTERGITPNSKRRRRRKRSLDETKELVHLMHLYNASAMAELRSKVAEHDRRDRELKRAQKAGSYGLGSLVKGLLSRAARSISTPADMGGQNVHYLGRLATFDADRFKAATQLISFTASVTPENCAAKTPQQLELPGEAGYGADTSFQVQARSALRLAHFLSAFSQNVNPDEVYGPFYSDKHLNRDQLFGEAFANVMSDGWIRSAGIYYDREAFWDPLLKRRIEYFGPTAFKLASDDTGDQKQRQLSFVAEDAAGWPLERAYFERDWFRILKQRWASNTYGLETFVNKPYVRTDLNGTGSKPFQRYPLYYRAPRFADMYWSKPYFDCNRNRDPNSRHVNDWVITVAAPFFGYSEQRSLQFLGVTAVTVRLDKLDINQCPGNFYEANYFKNSAPCHFESSYCVPVIQNKFQLENYKCECRQGFEYPYNDISIWFFAGGTVSSQYERAQRNETNYYRMLKCREGAGSTLLPSRGSILVAMLVGVLVANLSRD